MDDVIFTMQVHERKCTKYISMDDFKDLCAEHDTDPNELIMKNMVHIDEYGVRLTGKAKIGA